MGLKLVITNTKRKSLVFIDDTLKIFSLPELITAIQNNIAEKLYLVTGTSGTYIRSAPDATSKNNIDMLSVTALHLVAVVQGYTQISPLLNAYTKYYLESLPKHTSYIKPVDSFDIPSSLVQEIFKSHISVIRKSAKEFEIDQYVLGAIIIDEVARLFPYEPIFEKLASGVVGKGVSVGVAQVNIDTANDLIRKGVYNPNPDDKKLPFSRLSNKDREYLYSYVVQAKHNVRFSAGFIRYVIDFWSECIDLALRPDIIGTLYHQGYGTPKNNPIANKRGEQIAGEFYGYAKKWME